MQGERDAGQEEGGRIQIEIRFDNFGSLYEQLSVMGYKNLTPSKDNGVNDGIANIKQNKIFKQFQIVAMTTEEQEWMPTGDKDKAMEFFFFACNLLTAFKVQSKGESKV